MLPQGCFLQLEASRRSTIRLHDSQLFNLVMSSLLLMYNDIKWESWWNKALMPKQSWFLMLSMVNSPVAVETVDGISSCFTRPPPPWNRSETVSGLVHLWREQYGKGTHHARDVGNETDCAFFVCSSTSQERTVYGKKGDQCATVDMSGMKQIVPSLFVWQPDKDHFRLF